MNNGSQLRTKILEIMEKLEYNAPSLEVITLEVEGIIAASNWWENPTIDDGNDTAQPDTNTTSSFLNNYSRK